MNFRPVDHIAASKPTIEGAGVHLHRAFGYYEVPKYDPFLLLDDFGSDDPRDYLLGFPWHPHRGIETVTYVFAGSVRHKDSLGNSGTIGSGDIQWMTAGSGIIHEEMPEVFEGRMRGFQLWVNLPAKDKMADPRYQDIRASAVPEVASDGGVKVKVICGSYRGVTGPVEDLAVRPEYLDVLLPAGAGFTHDIPADRNAFAYVAEGAVDLGVGATDITADHVVHFGAGEGVRFTAGPVGARVLLVSGRPLGEPISWYGPIVMNTEAEIRQAFAEYEAGTFVKKGAIK